MAWITVDGQPVHVVTKDHVELTVEDRKALGEFVRALRCDHPNIAIRQRASDGVWKCTRCGRDLTTEEIEKRTADIEFWFLNGYWPDEEPPKSTPRGITHGR